MDDGEVKTTKKGSKTYGYWMASWRKGDSVRNVHIGSCAKMEQEVAIQRARKTMANAPGISWHSIAAFYHPI